MLNVKEAVLETNLPLPNKRQGKVRDIYDCTLPDGSQGLLIVASDRVSAFDVVLSNGIPGKGIVLTQISNFWFEHFSNKIEHHLVSSDPADIAEIPESEHEKLRGRIMICKKTNVVPIECVVRGYLTGSGLKDYQKTGQVCGIDLPQGMVNSQIIDQPIFTPATKAEIGLHDENISFEIACETAGVELMTKLRDLSLSIYSDARAYAAERGIIIADTKFEFGIPLSGGEPIIIDEVLTPDSSRFWPADEYELGREQNSLDKQFVRNYLQELCDSGQWNKTAPGPELPANIIENTLNRYIQAYEQLTGKKLDSF